VHAAELSASHSVFFPSSRKKDFLSPTKSSVFLAWLFQAQLYYPFNFWGHCHFFVRENQSLKFHVWGFFLSSTLVLFHFFPDQGTSDISKQQICCKLAQKKLRSCLCTFPQKTPPKLAALKKKI